MTVTPIAILGSIASILWLFSLIIVIFLSTKYIIKLRAFKISINTNIRLSIAMFIFSLVGAIGMLCKRFCKSLRDYGIKIGDLMETIEFFTNLIGTAAEFIAFTLILYIFVFRLQKCFKRSKWNYPQWFYITISLEILTVAIATFIGALFDNIVIAAAMFLLIINCTFLTLIFIHSLNKIKNMDHSDDKTTLEQIMVKFIALLILSMTTSSMFCLIALIWNLSGIVIFDGLGLVIQPIDATVNVLCIYLQYNFTKEDYYKWLPKYHNLIRWLFIKQSETESNLKQEIQMDKDQKKNIEISANSSV
eukprot:185047_1